MAGNAIRAIELGSHGIDINFGCPSKTVNKRQGGAVLLKEPDSLYRVVDAVRSAVPTHIKVSAKMRLGFDDTSLMLENASALEAGGADEITVHARTRQQGYRPPVYWQELGLIREHINIPMIANGDVTSLSAYERCKAESGIEDIMIGRGAVRQPDIANVIRDHCAEASWPQLETMLESFWLDISQTLSPKDRMGRIKQWLNYMRQKHLEAEELFQHIRLEEDARIVDELLLANYSAKAAAS